MDEFWNIFSSIFVLNNDAFGIIIMIIIIYLFFFKEKKSFPLDISRILVLFFFRIKCIAIIYS